jgi:hypothetical protein
MSLDREFATFQRELPNLLKSDGNRDKFVLIRGDTVYGVFDTEDDAVNAGWDRFGLFEQFLAQKITDHEEPVYFSRTPARCQ